MLYEVSWCFLCGTNSLYLDLDDRFICIMWVINVVKIDREKWVSQVTYLAPLTIEIVTGRGLSNKETEGAPVDRLISTGWDRSHFRIITMLGNGQFIAPTYCGAKNDRVNRGSYQLRVDQISSFSSEYLHLLYSVSIENTNQK